MTTVQQEYYNKGFRSILTEPLTEGYILLNQIKHIKKTTPSKDWVMVEVGMGEWDAMIRIPGLTTQDVNSSEIRVLQNMTDQWESCKTIAERAGYDTDRTHRLFSSLRSKKCIIDKKHPKHANQRLYRVATK